MQIMITAGRLARSRVVQVGPWQIGLTVATLALALMMFSGVIYHFVLLKAAQAGWPIVSQVVGLVVRDEMTQRDRFVRENLDALAQRVGEMQAKVVKLEAVGERVAGMAGIRADDVRVKPAPAGAQAPVGAPAPERRSDANPTPTVAAAVGGPYVPAQGGAPNRSFEQLDELIRDLELHLDVQGDRFLLAESRLLERRLANLLVPSTAPVEGPTSSGFGFRVDPFSGRAALHTGLDFPADPGAPIFAAAGGMVVSDETHPAYGRMLEIDHGRGLVTRYAHASRLVVKAGDIVRRGQKIAEVGSSGRSTGPHLHFEVLVDNVPQDPARFLASGGAAVGTLTEFAARPGQVQARGGPRDRAIR